MNKIKKCIIFLFIINYQINSMTKSEESYIPSLTQLSAFSVAKQFAEFYDNLPLIEQDGALKKIEDFIIKKNIPDDIVIKIYESIIVDFKKSDIFIKEIFNKFKEGSNTSILELLTSNSKEHLISDIIKVLLNFNSESSLRSFLKKNIENNEEILNQTIFVILDSINNIRYYIDIYSNLNLNFIKKINGLAFNDALEIIKKRLELAINFFINEVDISETISSTDIDQNTKEASIKIIENFNNENTVQAIKIFNSFSTENQNLIINYIFSVIFRENYKYYLYEQEKEDTQEPEYYLPAIEYLSLLLSENQAEIFNKIEQLYSYFSTIYPQALDFLFLLDEYIFNNQEEIFDLNYKVRVISVLKNYINQTLSKFISQKIKTLIKNPDDYQCRIAIKETIVKYYKAYGEKFIKNLINFYLYSCNKQENVKLLKNIIKELVNQNQIRSNILEIF